MESTMYKATTTFLGADGASSFYFDVEEKAQAFISEQLNGEVEEVTLISEDTLNYSDGCTFNDFTFGGIIKVTEKKNNRIKQLRRQTGLSQKAFAEHFGIPARTVQNWEYGVNEAPEYLLDLLEHATSDDEPRLVILATAGHEEVVFVGDKMNCARYEDSLRRECRRLDPDGAEIDCYIKSPSEMLREQLAKTRWDELTEEEKHDFIEVDGRKYVRKIWEANHPGEL